MRFFQTLASDLTTCTSDTVTKMKIRPILLKSRLSLQQATPEFDWGAQQQTNALKFLYKDEHKLPQSQRVACFYPFNSELDLTKLATEAWIFPYAAPNRQLRWFHWRPGKKGLQKNKWGILEPTRDETFAYNPHHEGALLMFVPSLATSLNFQRLGYGGGYYDSYLKHFQDSILTISCVPEDLLFDFLPTEPHDVEVDIIATETRVISRFTPSQLLCKLRT